jgi:hypothetical protein
MMPVGGEITTEDLIMDLLPEARVPLSREYGVDPDHELSDEDFARSVANVVRERCRED